MASLAHAAPLGYTISGGSLTRLDLGSAAFVGDGAVEPVSVSGLAVRLDGVLFAVAEHTDDLWQIDPADLPGRRVGALGVDVHAEGGLTFDACGTLWMTSHRLLYRVDPATGAATLVHDLGQSVSGLTAYGEELLGLVRVGAPNSLARIDPVSGTVTPYGSLVFLPTQRQGLDFDAEGRLWGLFLNDGGITPFWVSSIVEYDAESGSVLKVQGIRDAQLLSAIWGNLGVAPPRGSCSTAVEVPALPRHGLGLFAAALGLAACALFRWAAAM